MMPALQMLFMIATILSQTQDWQAAFPADKKNLGPTGSNAYFVLEP